MHGPHPSLMDLSSPHTQPMPPDTQAEVQHFEAWYGGLNSTSQYMQHPTGLGIENASGPSADERRGVQGSQKRQQEGGSGTSATPTGQALNGRVHTAAPRLSEKEAVAVVKPVLKLLYAEKLLMRQQFTDACKKAVHLLREGAALNTQTAVKEALSSMGLELAASRVS